MRVFSLPRDHLLLLDQALGGRIGDALASIAKAGGDPELLAVRVKPVGTGPSSWSLLVTGAGQTHQYVIDDVIGLGVAAHIHLVDYVDELKADLASRLNDTQLVDGIDLDGHLPRPNHPFGLS